MGLRYLCIFFTGMLAIVLCTSIIISITAKEYEFATSAILQLVFLSLGFFAGYSLAGILLITTKKISKPTVINTEDE